MLSENDNDMRIAVDYTPAIRQRAGIGRYTKGLVAALAELDHENEYILLVVGKGQEARNNRQEEATRNMVSCPLPTTSRMYSFS